MRRIGREVLAIQEFLADYEDFLKVKAMDALKIRKSGKTLKKAQQ